MEKRGQSAVEFILLITALLFICIPIFYLMSDFSFKASKDVSAQQMRETGQRLVDEAREMYYLGKFSKEIITVNMPENIAGMSTLIISGTQDEYYLLINYTGQKSQIDMPIGSEVPLISGNGCVFTANCYPGKDCTLCKFDEYAIKPGIKNFLIETLPSYNGMAVVNITQVTW